MMDAPQLDYIHAALQQVNKYKDMADRPMGIVLTGDFAQLPVVNGKMAFEAECWPEFESHTTKLTKVYRQDNLQFLSAINAARSGDGSTCALILKDLGVEFSPQAQKNYDGSTILAKNDQVDRFNYSALLDLPGDFFGLRSAYWGLEDKSWRKHIPDSLKLKIGAYVMILANSHQEGYANGDCGYIMSKTPEGGIVIKLVRNGEYKTIWPVVRSLAVTQDEAEKSLGEELDPFEAKHVKCGSDCESYEGMESPRWVWGEPSYNCGNGTWNVGGVKFYPIRAAYATTVHKSQGLTLDQCQIDVRDFFFGQPGMAYVALSRCRTPEGLTIVGSPAKLAERIKVDERVRRWL